MEALRLIYEKVPEAMTHFFDRAVLFPKRKDANGKWINPNFKEVSIKWGAIFGYEKMCSEEKVNPYENLKAESTNLRYALRSEKWGAQVLCHPLVRLYLELKWKKIQWFFWITFLLEVQHNFCDIHQVWLHAMQLKIYVFIDGLAHPISSCICVFEYGDS